MNATEDAIGALLSLILLVPDEGRRFDADDNIARRQHGLSEPLVQALVDAGLPHRSVNGIRLFDRHDLSNASLELGLPSIRRMAMRTWSKTLQESDRRGRLNAVIHLGMTDSATEPRREIRVEAYAKLLLADGALALLLEEFRHYKFFMLPEIRRWDLNFITDHRICECGGASRLLVERSRPLGIPVRQCFGLLVAEPYSTGHYWAEFLIEGEWIAFDPLLLALLHRVTRLAPDQWPILRSNAAMLHRLCVVDQYEPHGAPIVEGMVDPVTQLPLGLMAGQTLMATLPCVFVENSVGIVEANESGSTAY